MSLTIAGLSKSFRTPDGRSLPVISDVSFTVGRGEFVCLLGPSGCGKSTILNVLTGLVRPDRGQVLLDDRAVEDIGEQSAYMFQSPRLLNWKTARQNLEFVLTARGIDGSEAGRRIERYLGMVSLKEFQDWYPLRLSGGMQQRVALARALCVEYPILLMDEPFSGLDEFTARELRDELLRIWEHERKTVLFVTHNTLEAAYLADRVLVFTPRPAEIARVMEVEVPRPRQLDDPVLLGQYTEILQEVIRAGRRPDQQLAPVG